jgi:hypothetical protein
MRLLLPLALLMVALYACEAPLPDGAYVPNERPPPGGDDDYDAEVKLDGMVAPPIGGGTTSGPTGGGTTGGDAGVPGGTTGGGTTGGGTAGGGDAGTGLSEKAKRLEKLVGKYFMRMDMLSRARASSGPIEVRTTNRSSHLLAVELRRDGERLIGYERMCYQTFEHTCLESCSSLRTTMNPNVKIDFVKMPYAERYYSFDGTTLRSEPQSALFGFDSQTNKALPSAYTDARLWDPATGNSVREGLMLRLESTGSLVGVTCNVYTVQEFISSFTGSADAGDGSNLSLLNRSFVLSTSGVGKTLGASDNKCMPTGNEAAPEDLGQSVRFAQVQPNEFDEQSFWGCPAQSEWDKRLAPPAPPAR